MNDEQRPGLPPGVTEIGEMQWSEDCGELFAAFAAAQANLGPLIATREAKVSYENKKTGKKGEYIYKYGGLPETLEACVAAYTAAGCAIVQPISTFDNGIGVRTLITHSSGQWWLSPKVFIPVSDGSGAQDLGSAITYGRRYSLQGAVALSPADDDDGEGAQESKPSSWSAPRESSRRTEPGRKPKDIGPRCSGSKGGHIADANERYMRTISDHHGCEMGDVWSSGIKAVIDSSKYVAGWPTAAQQLTIADGMLLRDHLKSKLPVEREPGDDDDGEPELVEPDPGAP